MEVYAEHLADLSREQLQRAFWRASRDLKFFPKLAELRELAGALPDTLNDGRPGPEEAWARMPKRERMEDDSIVWCEEERAAYEVCRPLLLDGDLVAARVAFKERYQRELAEARGQGRPPEWTMSAGYDIERRLTTLANAVQEGRISVESALEFVPGERQDDFARMLPIAYRQLLLTGEAKGPSSLLGLAGVLAKMRMEDTVPENLKAKPSGDAHTVRPDRSPDEWRELREKANAQIEFLKRSHRGSGSGVT